MFQVGLGIIGLALAVPLNLSAMIIAGAVLGKVLLGDPVSRRTIVAIVVLITAAVVLSLGSDASALEREVSWRRLAGGLVAIITSGVAYSFFGVTMRHSLRQGLTVPLAMFTSGIAGVVLLFPLAIQQAGWQQIASTPQSQWLMMGAAGLLNTAAFFMLSFALRAIPVVAVNLLNATQATLAALMGVMIFAEPLTGTLIGGSVLTVAGLVVLGSGRRRLAPGGARKQNPDTSPEQSPPLERSASPGESGGSRQATSPKSSTAPYRRTACDLSPANSDASKLGSSSRIS
jgi:drug/metabolite transporter (DMT)-like permease